MSWQQTEVDGLTSAPISALRRGATWCWRGEAVCIDAATGFSGLLDGHAAGVVRTHAVQRARSVIGRALVAEGLRTPFMADPPGTAQTLTLTDGPRRWTASLIDMPELARPMLMFLGDLPPREAALRVAVAPEAARDLRHLNEASEGVVCFTEGTRLDTVDGARPVQEIVAGDRVVTKDGGAEEVLWVGLRHISRARLLTTPDLRPVRIRAGAMAAGRPAGDLVVSPDHRMLTGGPATRAIWDEAEVLVAARDMVDGKRIIRDPGLGPVTYYHLMLAQHGILIANGLETESFHPGAAALGSVAQDQRLRMFDVMPDLEHDAGAYGPMARRVLNRDEAGLLAEAS